jgi:hypothetical protein
VWFTDGSVVDIHGHGTVIFADNGGDHKAFTDVLPIPALKSSVVSLDQLNKGLFDITSSFSSCLVLGCSKTPVDTIKQRKLIKKTLMCNAHTEKSKNR